MRVHAGTVSVSAGAMGRRGRNGGSATHPAIKQIAIVSTGAVKHFGICTNGCIKEMFLFLRWW